MATACALLTRAAGAADAPGGDRDRFRADLRQLCAHPSRVVGSDGYQAAGQWIERQLRDLPNVDFRRHEFEVMVPITRWAELVRVGGGGGGGGAGEKIYPFWPAGVRVNATPADGITGRCVYVRHAGFEQITPRDLAGQIAVVEAAAGAAWTHAFSFGARAVLILGNDQTNNADLRHHELVAPADLPRFYVPPGKLADDLRSGAIQHPVTLRAAVDWQPRSATNFYALVRPAGTPVAANRSPGSRGGGGSAGVRGGAAGALVISVPYDSTSLVPDLSPGASQAAQTASGLALLRHLAANPPSRPVLFFFGGGDGVQMLATRNLFMALGDVPAHWRPEIGEVERKLTSTRAIVDRLAAVAQTPAQLDPARDRAAVDRIASVIETDAALEQDILFRVRRDLGLASNAEALQREKHLDDRQGLLGRLRYAFVQRPGDLTGEMDPPAREYLVRTLSRARALASQHEARLRVLRDRVDLYEWLARAIGRDVNPAARANDSRLIELLVALDLSDRGVRVGPMFVGNFQDTSNISQIQDHRDWFTRQERAFLDNDPAAAWWGEIAGRVDLAPFAGARSAETWRAAPVAIGSELCQAWGVPGFTLMTLDDVRLRRDTPTDTPERLDADAIFRQFQAVRELLLRAWSDPAFRGPAELKWQRTQFSGQVVSAAPGRPVPDLPRDGFLVTYAHTESNLPRIPQPRAMPYAMGVRRSEVRATDADGAYLFEAMPRLGEQQIVAVAAFRPEPGSGQITACTDLGRQLGAIKLYADLKQDLPPLRSVVFTCEEFPLVGLYDPRFLQDLGEVVPLDARRNAEPQRFNVVVADRVMAGFVEPGARTSLIFRFGRVGNRLLLTNMSGGRAMATSRPSDAGRASLELGAGYTVAELRALHPLALATAWDFNRLDALRQADYRRAGVSSTLIDSLQVSATSQAQLAAAAVVAGRDASVVMGHATGAWASDARVYSATQDLANDVVRGAIFLLLLCVPFAFCMERLLVAASSIYRQIAAAVGIFALMTAALWAFHPAFRISSSPLIIVLAFAIIFMSAVVTYVIYGKFDAELKRLRAGGRGEAPATSMSFARASVLTSAVLLGIANMRRRRFRTVLTSTTIVLITFAVLCFTSTTRYLDTITLPAGEASRYAGVMLRQRGYRPLPPVIVQNLKPLVGRRQIVERWWNANPESPREMINLVAAAAAAAAAPTGGGGGGGKPRVVAAAALLGLSPGESQLSPVASVLGAQQFARLERGERDIVYLSTAMAAPAGLKEGDVVRIGGIDVQVAGLFDAARFDREVRALSGEPIAPLKFEANLLDAGGRQMSDASAESLDLNANAAGRELGATYEYLPAQDFAIVPASLSRLLPNAALRSVAVRAADSAAGGARADADVKLLADELARRFAVALFAGYSDGVRMVSAGNLSSVSGAGQVAIPLAIAGLIIFNTMLGSIAERRREIHVYTSLGLAPLHVGALFVAEAMVYGLIGVVFGYVIGQGAGTLLLKLGLLGSGVTLNYSGTSAMMTMGLILLIVLASSIVPARMAARVAAPSIERSWRVPGPRDGQIEADLPFTINRTAADGAIAYLAEFFAAHREGSIGKFSADRIEAFSGPGYARGNGDGDANRGNVVLVDTAPGPGMSAVGDGANRAAPAGAASLTHGPNSSGNGDRGGAAAPAANGNAGRGLRTIVWLTPFDLGVRQELTLVIRPGEHPDIYEVRVTLRRLSGDDGSWYRMNRPFLTELRRQFLRWRSLSSEQMLDYVAASRRLFAEGQAR